MRPTDDARAVLREVLSAGGCSHPVRLLGDVVDVETGELRTSELKVPCKDRRAAVCASCSRLYKADAWILVAAGMNGGKGVPLDVRARPRLFVTLTAPSFGAVHQSAQGQCRSRRQHRTCRHGHTTWCDSQHEPHVPDVGSPLCERCFDYRGAVLWNAHASRLWDRTFVRLRQRLAQSQGLSVRELAETATVSYLKVAELQRRGLVHFHAVLRADGPLAKGGYAANPPEWLTAELLASNVTALIREVELRDGGTTLRWGTQFDVAILSATDDELTRIASYVAKYAVKTTDGTVVFARQFQSRAHIERSPVPLHLKRLATTSWDLGRDPRWAALRLRAHAHNLGFTGQLLTKSRGYSTTFTELRSARARFQRSGSEWVALPGTFGYRGRGYDHPVAEQVAELLFEMERELAMERRATAESSVLRADSEATP
jgi:hypothetical protein